MLGKILFKGNPWPNGHAVTEFVWTGRLDPEKGAIFDFHLKTADYSADGDGTEGPGDWNAPIVWGNYHACTLSSTMWSDDAGFTAGTTRAPIDLETLTTKTFRVDPLPFGADDEPAFGIYLLGHDSVADHEIRFVRRHQPDTFHLSWRGKIALTYAGDEVFRHAFEASIPRARFDGFLLPEGTEKKQAFALLRAYVKNPDAYALLRRGERRRFALRASAEGTK
jgi:hypothetical protein